MSLATVAGRVDVGAARRAVALPRSSRVEAEKLRVRMLSDPRGVHDFPGVPRAVVSVHVGPAADVACHRGGESHRGKAVHGDVDIIPMGMRSRWVNQDRDTVLVMSLAPDVLDEIVVSVGRDPRRLQIHNRFQVRDASIEHLAWALKEEMDRGFPSGRLFLDSMAAASGDSPGVTSG